jgi:hypothetical protein
MEVAMKRYILAVALIVVPLLFFGCTATPNVKYRAKDDIKKTYIPVALIASRVTITMPATASPANQASPAKPANPAKPEGKNNGDSVDQKKYATSINITPKPVTITELKEKAVIIVTPTQAEGSLRYLEPQDDLLRTTSLSITYFDGMKVPKTVGIVVEDRSVKLISAIGVFITAALPIIAAAPERPTPPDTISLPILIDFSKPDVFANTESEICKPLDGENAAYYVCYKITPREGRAKNDKKEMYTYKEFYNAYEDTYTGNLAFSRCADLDAKIVTGTGQTRKDIATFTATIADPYHVDWLPMPLKGQISAQDICGANSSTEKSDNPRAPEVMDELTKQVTAVWKALHPPEGAAAK